MRRKYEKKCRHTCENMLFQMNCVQFSSSSKCRLYETRVTSFWLSILNQTMGCSEALRINDVETSSSPHSSRTCQPLERRLPLITLSPSIHFSWTRQASILSFKPRWRHHLSSALFPYTIRTAPSSFRLREHSFLKTV